MQRDSRTAVCIPESVTDGRFGADRAWVIKHDGSGHRGTQLPPVGDLNKTCSLYLVYLPNHQSSLQPVHLILSIKARFLRAGGASVLHSN